MDELNRLRSAIDKADDALLKTLLERAQLARKIGNLKAQTQQQQSTTFFRPEREAQIMRRLLKLKETVYPTFSDASVQSIFREIMSACLAQEQVQTISYLGPEGTFSHEAALGHFGHAAVFSPQPSTQAVFNDVCQGHSQYGVIPLENSFGGVVSESIDGLIADTELSACLEIKLLVQHNLIAGAGTTLKNIEKIYAHQQSFKQCHNWLSCFKADQLVPVASNAQAAQMAKDNGIGYAAIASKTAAQIYGLEILKSNTQNSFDNQTRFIVISKNKTRPSGKDKTLLALAIKNETGALHKILAAFSEAQLSLSLIQSRPSHKTLWDYIFYIEVEGHHDEPPLKDVLKTLLKHTNWLRVLGSFPQSQDA